MGYHKRAILRGVYGEASKIREEAEELEDAVDQGVKIMVMTELADLYGAIEAYAANLGLSMEDIRLMNERTKEAFRDGTRRIEVQPEDCDSMDDIPF